MTYDASAPWHRRSFDAFIERRLPELLAARLPLAGYRAEPSGPHAWRVRVAIAAAGGDVELDFAALPRPDEEGIFHLGDARRVVVPTVSSDDLEAAEVRCAGEQLSAFAESRLGEAPRDLVWDEALLRAWLPLDAWFAEFLRVSPTAQVLEDGNWLARQAHLRRLMLPERASVYAATELGRLCPFETPEGPRIGRVMALAVGAAIEGGRLVIRDARPEAAIGLTASMVPLLEHDDPNRLLMGVNMMRQWLVPPEPEPALVRTGHEPDAPGFWCGRNLLTAFISWGTDTYEDSIVLSESAARRLSFARPIEPGDKLSNRHGTKGTVGRILPDREMPHLADGTPVELVFDFIGLHTRLNLGQVREAVLGRIARAEGAPVVAAPFHAPSAEDIRARLEKAGLPPSGMETLRAGRGGPPLERPSTAGWVYWGLTHHLAGDKIFASVSPPGAHSQGDLEYFALRDVGALELLAEQFNTRSVRRADADTLAARVAAGALPQAGPPTPAFAELADRLAAAGIRAELRGERLHFRLAPPEGDLLRLAQPVPHPWLPEHLLAAVGVRESVHEYGPLAEANRKLQRLLAGRAPASLAARAAADLQAAVKAYLGALVTPQEVRLGGRVLFTGRAVLVVGPDLRIDQIGLPDEMAWTLFGPLVVRRLGGPAEVEKRTRRAAQALDELMAASWVVFNRAPTVLPTSFLAFRPLRVPERVIRLHPLACMLVNGDFDGDLGAVFLPITDAAQREAAEKLSVAGHLRRDPDLVQWAAPNQEMIWGLAELSRTSEGRDEIAALAGIRVAAPDGIVTRASVVEALRARLQRDGPEAALEAAGRLMRRGFEVAKRSGASLSPFAGASLPRPEAPAEETLAAWQDCKERIVERLASSTDFDDPEIGPQVLAVRSGARGNLEQLAVGLQARAVVDARGRIAISPRGLIDGLSPRVMFAAVVGARKGLAAVVLDFESTRVAYGVRPPSGPKGFSVLSRAMRAGHPGIVFASAAACGEVDPLADLDSRLFVGLPPPAGAA